MAEAGFAAPLVRQLSYHWQAPNEMTMYHFMLDLFGLDKHPALTDMQMAWRQLGWKQNEQVCLVPWSLGVMRIYKAQSTSVV